MLKWECKVKGLKLVVLVHTNCICCSLPIRDDLPDNFTVAFPYLPKHD